MGGPLINVRVPEEWVPQIKAICDNNNITVSEYVRGLIAASMEDLPPGVVSLGGFSEGYQQGRALATRIARALLIQAIELVPDSYEEAMARYPSAFNSPGRRPKADGF